MKIAMALRQPRAQEKKEPHLAPASAARKAREARAAETPDELNAYVEARREWNERYGDYLSQARNWRLIALICALLALAAVAGLAYIGAQSKLVPYVVEVDQLGQTLAIRAADRAAPVDQRVVKSFIGRFVTDWRTVSTDRQLQLDAIHRVYSLLPKGYPALQKVNEYYQANDPFKRGAAGSVSVQLISVLVLSKQTWQVEWWETARDTKGDTQSRVRWRASLTVVLNPPSNENQILSNPLGVYISELNWAQQL